MTAQEVHIPRSIRLSETGDGIRITYSWYKVKYLVTLFLTPVFAWFLIRSDYVAGDFHALSVPGALVLVVAFLIVYYSLARVLNNTKIEVEQDRIIVRTGPIPYTPNHSLKKADVAQLYVTRNTVGHRYYITITKYQVNALLEDDSEVTLVRGLTSVEQGWFIENKIESFFRITDVPVEGEVDKS